MRCGRRVCRSDYIIIFIKNPSFCGEALPPRDYSSGKGAKRWSHGGMRLAAKPNWNYLTETTIFSLMPTFPADRQTIPSS